MGEDSFGLVRQAKCREPMLPSWLREPRELQTALRSQCVNHVQRQHPAEQAMVLDAPDLQLPAQRIGRARQIVQYRGSWLNHFARL